MEANTTTKLLTIISENVSGDVTITPESTFEELGMDSLDFICMINEVREKVGPITDLKASKCEKVSDLLGQFSA